MLNPSKEQTFFEHNPNEYETPKDENIVKPIPVKAKDMYSVNYVLNDIVLKQIEVYKNIYLRVIKVGDEVFLDINQFHGGKPTKKGIRFPIRYVKIVKNAIENV